MFVVSYGAMISVTLCMPYPVDTCGYNYFESWIYPFASHMGFRVGIKNPNDIYVYIIDYKGCPVFCCHFTLPPIAFFQCKMAIMANEMSPKTTFLYSESHLVNFIEEGWSLGGYPGYPFLFFFEGRIFWRQSSQKESFKQEAKESFQSKSDWARTNIFCALMTNAQDFSWWSLGILNQLNTWTS